MSEKPGVTFLTSDEQRSASADGWVADRRLGLTADRTRVVDYFDVEAAFLFRPPGKKVTAEESERYGISPEHPYSPKPGEHVARETPPEVKEAPPPEDKAVKRAEVEDKSVRPKRRRGA